MFRCNISRQTYRSMNDSRLFFTIYLAVGSIILLFAVWSNIIVYAQQISSPTILPPSTPSSLSNTTISPEIKAKMCNPSNPSLKAVNTTEARICGIPKTVGPALASSVAQPPKTTTSPSAAPLAQSSKNTGSSNNTSSGIITTTTTNVHIVLRPLPGGTCPTGYHLVSGTVCIKDIPSSAQQQTTPAALPTTTNATKSLPVSSSPATTQPSHTNPTKNDNNKDAANSNNEENFHTKILKSFNKKFK